MTAADSVRQHLRRARVPPAVDRVILRVRELLIARTLSPGDKLPSEMELAELFGVSRGSVREAMKILCGYGIVTIRAGDGTYVATECRGALFEPMLFQMLLSSPDRQALRELRQLLELGMVPLLAAHVTAADVAGLRAALARTEELVTAGCTDPEALTDADLAFHRVLGQTSHNPLVERIYAFAMDYLRPTVRDTYVRSRTGGHGLETHGAILRALENRDAEALQRAVAASIQAWDELR